MINVSETATQELKKYFEDKEVQPIRVHMVEGGCSGPQLSLALDEVRDGDKSVELGDFTFVITEELAGQTGEINIELTQWGFTVKPENEMGGGSCGDGCGSCGCSCG